MRARTELVLALAVFLGLVLLAMGAGLERRGPVATDLRASSLVAGPAGTRALAEVAQRAGTPAVRWRRRLQAMPDTLVRDATVLVVQPSRGLAAGDALHLLDLTSRTTSLLVAGAATEGVFRCLGWDVDYALIDSARVVGPSGLVRRGVTTVLSRRASTDRSMASGPGQRAPCPAVPIASVDTLLRTDRGQPVALAVRRADSKRVILVVSDAALVSNAGLAVPELPEVIVGALFRTGGRLVFDEFHHVGTGGSLLRATLGWSARSPWGWMTWQLAFVGLLAFLSGALRFGPVREAIARQRRSPLEHVKALATALAASNGHDAAIASLVRGLRRRLAAGAGEGAGTRARASRDSWRSWLDGLAGRIPDPVARTGAERLARYATPDQPASAVRAAANTVEDVWEALHR